MFCVWNFARRRPTAGLHLPPPAEAAAANVMAWRRLLSTATAPRASTAAFEASLAAKRWWRALYDDGGDTFTLSDVSPTLTRFWPLLSGAEGADGPPAPPPRAPAAAERRVLAPLCGRDISTTFLASRPGWRCVGVDFADSALRKLGAEIGGLVPQGAQGATLGVYRTENYPRLLLVHGDFFGMAPEDFGGGFHAVWDRGGLTSVGGAAERAAYAARVAQLMEPGGRLLLELLDTNIEMEGAVDAGEAAACLAGAGLRVRELARRDVRGEYPDFRPPGLAYLREVVLLGEKP